MPDQLRFERSLPILIFDPLRNGKGHGRGRIPKLQGPAAELLGQKVLGFEHISLALQRTAQADHVTRHQIGQPGAVVGVRDADAHEVAAGVDDLSPGRSSLPVAIVRGVHAEDDQEAQQRSEHGVLGGGQIKDVPPAERARRLVSGLNRHGVEGQRQHADRGPAQRGPAVGDYRFEPVLAVVLDHGVGRAILAFGPVLSSA